MIYSRYWFLLFFFLFFVVNTTAQNTTFVFKNESIPTIIQKIEGQADWVFNYDPQILGTYTFNGSLKKGSINNQLTQLFYHTPYTFEINDKSILIFLETPKNYRLCGTIKDKESKVTLPLANVFSDDQTHGVQADNDGNFDFSFTAYKHQMVTISYIGYQSQSFVIQEFNQSSCQDFFLAIDTELFGEEIIVKDYILPEITEGEGYGGVHIDYQKLAQRQTIIEQDVLKTVQLIPGINSVDESATNLQIRGGTPDQNLVLWEDITLYDPGHLFGMLSAINPYVVEKVQVYKGAFDPRYDNRVGGIVDLSLSDDISDKFHGGLGSTLTEAHAYFKAPIVKNKLSLLLSGRNSIHKIFNSPTLQNYSTKVFQGTKIEDQKDQVEEGEVDVAQQLDFYDVNGKLIFKPTDKLTFKASWLQTQNTFNYQAELFEDEVSTIDNVLFDSRAINLATTLQLKVHWDINIAYRNSTYSNDYQLTFVNSEEEEEERYINNVYNDIKDEGVIIRTNYQLQPNLGLQVGYDYNQKEVNFSAEITSEFEEDLMDFNFGRGRFHNVFASLNYQQQNLQINGGIRATYFVEANHTATAPRVNVQYALSDQLKLKISGGVFQQYISQLKEFGDNALGLNNQVWVLNQGEDEDDILQTAKKIAGGFVYHHQGWLVDLEGYYHQTDGLSTLGPSFGTSSAASDIDDFSTGSSKSIGIDLLVKKGWRNYQTWLNYSLSKVSFDFPNIFDDAFTASNEQRHNLSLVNSYTYKKWNVSLSYQYKTGLPYTRGIGVDSDVDLEDLEETGDVAESTFYFVDYADPNADRLPDYSRLDIGISYRPTFKNPSLKGELTFSVINLLNKTNTFRRDYFIDDLEDEEGEFIRPQLFGTDKRLLKRTPLVSLRVYW